MSRLKTKFAKEVSEQIMAKFGFKNPNRVPKIAKIVINMGFGVVEKEAINTFTAQLAAITGQKPVVTKARKSISNFKIREDMVIGAKVTLRGDRMYEFMDRLISAALPRIRDFRGLSANAFDGRGNYTLGLKEQTIFPEIDANHAGVAQGMDITFATTARNDDEARELLRLLGMPFVKNQGRTVLG